MKDREEKKRKKLDIPEIISDDLTYYMQFGFKRTVDRVNTRRDEIKYQGRIYSNRNIDESNAY